MPISYVFVALLYANFCFSLIKIAVTFHSAMERPIVRRSVPHQGQPDLTKLFLREVYVDNGLERWADIVDGLESMDWLLLEDIPAPCRF